MRKILTIIICLASIIAFIDAHSILAQESRTQIRKRLIEKKDFRIPVIWITKTVKDYGPGDYGRTLTLDTQVRYYEIHIPQNYDGSKPFPVVLLFHGGGGDPGTIRYESGMDYVSNHEEFIVVYPAGTNRRLLLKNRLLLWNDGRPYNDGTYNKIDDVGYVIALLNDLETLFNIDKKRIYACGYSNGAQFTYRLAKQLSDRIRAIAVVAGQRPASDPFDKPASRPISIMQFAGLQDEIAPYHGGSGPDKAEIKAISYPIAETIKSWVNFNGCPSKPIEVLKKGKAVMERYGPGENGTEVILWTLEDGGHTWPGGKVVPNVEALRLGKLGNVNQDINASELMWIFFKGYPSTKSE